MNSRRLARRVKYKDVFHNFIPPEDLRELRVVSRYRDKTAQTLAGEKNRTPKVLDDAGIKLGAVVSDINGVSAQAA